MLTAVWVVLGGVLGACAVMMLVAGLKLRRTGAVDGTATPGERSRA
jgi:hypothetical protein